MKVGLIGINSLQEEKHFLEIKDALQNEQIVIKELDIQGLKQIKETIKMEKLKLFEDKLRSIFLMPPNEEILIERITKRSKIKEAELHARLDSAKKEIKEADICDYIIETTEEDGIEDVYEMLVEVLELEN